MFVFMIIGNKIMVRELNLLLNYLIVKIVKVVVSIILMRLLILCNWKLLVVIFF